MELANPSIKLEDSDVHKVLFILNLPGLDAYDRKKAQQRFKAYWFVYLNSVFDFYKSKGSVEII